jgi:hypothetical protein
MPKQPHPLLAGRDKRIWWPDAVGVVRGYPRTEATFNRLRGLPPPAPGAALEQTGDTPKAASKRLGFARAILEGFRDGMKG